MPEQSEWVITVDDDHLDQLDQIVSELERSGLAVDRVLRMIGQISGHAEEACEQAFIQVRGVVSVDLSSRRGIAPPDEPVQ